MSDEKKNEAKPEGKLSDDTLDQVAGGTTGAGILYPGQTETPQASTWAVDSGLGVGASGFKLDQPSKPPTGP